MAKLIYQFSEQDQKEIFFDPLFLALRFLLWRYDGSKNLAYKLGVSKNVINLWQRNIKKPNEENLQKICDLLNIRKNIIKNW